MHLDEFRAHHREDPGWALYFILEQIINLNIQLSKLMSAISDFATKQSAFNDRMDTAVADLQADVQSLNDQIAALQSTSGAITPEDQALLDGLQTRASTIADKLDTLDALTPPVVPKTP